jgi:hypothetical protein
MRSKTQKEKLSRSGATKEETVHSSRISSSMDLHRLEFHRHGFALVPDPSDPRPGVAFFLKGDNHDFCNHVP